MGCASSSPAVAPAAAAASQAVPDQGAHARIDAERDEDAASPASAPASAPVGKEPRGSEDVRVQGTAATGLGAGAHIRAVVGVADSVDASATPRGLAPGSLRGSLVTAEGVGDDDEFDVAGNSPADRAKPPSFDSGHPAPPQPRNSWDEPSWLAPSAPPTLGEAEVWAPEPSGGFVTPREGHQDNALAQSATRRSDGSGRTPQEEVDEMRKSASKLDKGFLSSGDYTKKMQSIDTIDPTSPVRPTYDPNERMISYETEWQVPKTPPEASNGIMNNEYQHTPGSMARATKDFESSFDAELAAIEADADRDVAASARRRAAASLGGSFDAAAQPSDPLAMPEFAHAAGEVTSMPEAPRWTGSGSFSQDIGDRVHAPPAGPSLANSAAFDDDGSVFEREDSEAPPPAPRWDMSALATQGDNYVPPPQEEELPPELPPEPLDPWEALQRRFEEEAVEVDDAAPARPPPAPRWRTGAVAPPEETIYDRDEDDDPWLSVKVEAAPNNATWGLVDGANAGDVDFSRKLPAAPSGGSALEAAGGAADPGDLYLDEDFEDLEDEILRDADLHSSPARGGRHVVHAAVPDVKAYRTMPANAGVVPTSVGAVDAF